ncbi:MAG: spmX [Caulobacteraceae bacterium]|nr:spmX [Caulobacteraceae bacterium]
MKPRHQISRKGIELIKQFEGYRRSAARLADGGWTIGYGHTRSAREGAQVSEPDAEALLVYDLIAVQAQVNRLVFTPLTQNQYDTLVSFAFNIGAEAFRTSAVLRRINEGALLQAAYALEMWRKADFEGERIVLDALIRRRAAEKALFLTPTDGYVPAPTPILPPKIDYDAATALPRQLPLNLVVSMDGDLAEAHQQDLPLDAPAEPGSATAQAAEAVAARLQALIPETDEPPTSPGALAPRTASPEADREEPAREAVDPVSAPASEMTGETDVEPLQMGAPTPAQDHPMQPTIYGPQDEGDMGEARIGPMGVERRKTRKMRVLPYGPLLGLGLLFFLGGVAWQVMQKDTLGLGIALLGALLIAVSIYYLLQQIDEDPRP